MPDDEREPWVMPDWMGPYIPHITNTGGNPVEELMNDHHTTAQINAIRSALIISVNSQVAMLHSLHKAGLLNLCSTAEI